MSTQIQLLLAQRVDRIGIFHHQPVQLDDNLIEFANEHALLDGRAGGLGNGRQRLSCQRHLLGNFVATQIDQRIDAIHLHHLSPQIGQHGNGHTGVAAQTTDIDTSREHAIQQLSRQRGGALFPPCFHEFALPTLFAHLSQSGTSGDVFGTAHDVSDGRLHLSNLLGHLGLHAQRIAPHVFQRLVASH